MKRLIVTGPRQVRFEDVPPPPCRADGLLVRATHTALSTGTEMRVFRAIPVDDQGQFLHECVPFELPAFAVREEIEPPALVDRILPIST